MFQVVENPADTLLDRIQALEPSNPFHSRQYARARQRLGHEVLALLVKGETGIVAGCTAFLLSGRMNRLLEIQSLPLLPAGTAFWDGLREYCRTHGISKLTLNSFGSEAAAIPVLGREVWRKARTEYVIDLDDPERPARLKSNHKRNIKRARKAGLEVRTSTDLHACRTHAALIGMSMTRRKNRGEDVDAGVSVDPFAHLVDGGVGCFYQVTRDDEILSSMLVLTAPEGAYYHSAGTTADGMSMGASHMLVDHISTVLRDAKMRRFNLGGTDPDQEGLIRFKTGFGARPIALEAAKFDFAGAPLRIAEAIGRLPTRIMG